MYCIDRYHWERPLATGAIAPFAFSAQTHFLWLIGILVSIAVVHNILAFAAPVLWCTGHVAKGLLAVGAWCGRWKRQRSSAGTGDGAEGDEALMTSDTSGSGGKHNVAFDGLTEGTFLETLAKYRDVKTLERMRAGMNMGPLSVADLVVGRGNVPWSVALLAYCGSLVTLSILVAVATVQISVFRRFFLDDRGLADHVAMLGAASFAVISLGSMVRRARDRHAYTAQLKVRAALMEDVGGRLIFVLTLATVLSRELMAACAPHNAHGALHPTMAALWLAPALLVASSLVAALFALSVLMMVYAQSVGSGSMVLDHVMRNIVVDALYITLPFALTVTFMAPKAVTRYWSSTVVMCGGGLITCAIIHRVWPRFVESVDSIRGTKRKLATLGSMLSIGMTVALVAVAAAAYVETSGTSCELVEMSHKRFRGFPAAVCVEATGKPRFTQSCHRASADTCRSCTLGVYLPITMAVLTAALGMHAYVKTALATR